MVTDKLRDEMVKLAREAGKAILEVRDSGELDVNYKSDNSPVTGADLAANKVIVAALRELAPEVPIISEESMNASARDRRANRYVWIVDPLDGTKEFVAGKDSFTVNIALACDGVPVLGAVHAPALELVYSGGQELGAHKQIAGEDTREIRVNSEKPHSLVAVVRSADVSPDTETFLKTLGRHRTMSISSSLKLCYVADGTADIFPHLNPCMEWDTAAADAVLRAAGGRALQYEGRELLQYNKTELHNPWFVALGPPMTF